jgi:hypothetical protein
MPTEIKKEIKLEIAHVLYMNIVGRVLSFCVTLCVTRMGKNVQIPDYS